MDELMSLMIPRAKLHRQVAKCCRRSSRHRFLATVRCSVGLQDQLAALPAFDVSDQKSQGGPVCVGSGRRRCPWSAGAGATSIAISGTFGSEFTQCTKLWTCLT